MTITPNGSEKIGGVASNLVLNVDGQATTLVYVDSTKGWINVQMQKIQKWVELLLQLLVMLL